MEIFDRYIEINGSRQNIMTMRTKTENPILLIVHGGAGLPDRPLVKEYSSELADYYTVVCWDQRGCGLSRTKGKLDIDTLLTDLKELVEYLRKEYNQDKIYIAGHSFGSYIALRFTYMHPEYIEYYIGTGQKVSAIEAEIDKYNFLKAEATKRNDKKVLQQLEHFGEPEGNTYKNDNKKAKSFVLATLFKYSGYFSTNGPSMGKYLSQYSKLYSKTYGIHLPATLIGLVKSLIALNAEMDETDMITPITELSVPVLIIFGEEDMVCPKPTAKRWFDKLTAPKKEFIEIKNASHMVNFEKAAEWNEAVKSLLKENN
ncbi:MAG: alpha/beta hydrolase [Clostridia bacterium]|nr:alpha/beta hydrolase [Clostridia bacterium]